MTAMILTIPKIATYNFAYAASHPQCDAPVILRFLGEGASIVSGMSVLQADRYFHGGAGHIEDECRGILGPGEEKDGHDHDHHAEDHPEASPFNVLFRMSDALRVTEHIHLEGNNIKEIVPWLYYAAELDPHNIQAYLLIGYWVGDRMGKVDEAITFLRKGLRDNPDSWEINAELGRLYFQRIKDYKTAAMYLTRAEKLLRKAPHDKFQERYVLSLLAYSYKALGQDDEALPLYKRLNELFPNEV